LTSAHQRQMGGAAKFANPSCRNNGVPWHASTVNA
jgi:hypothetical protein